MFEESEDLMMRRLSAILFLSACIVVASVVKQPCFSSFSTQSLERSSVESGLLVPVRYRCNYNILRLFCQGKL